MHKGLQRISTLNMPRDEWLERRRTSIGGSDAAAIMGLNDWSSPYSVWADKTGRLPETPDNEAMRQGRDLEEYVAQRWCEETGKRVRRVNAILLNPIYPFAHANADRFVVGEDAGLECKTTSVLNLKKFKNGEYPTSYYVQCIHYMAVTGVKRWYLAVLVLNKGFYLYTIERDEAEIAALMAQEKDFWRHVTKNTPPPVDGAEATTEAIKTIYFQSTGGTVDLFGRNALLDEYHEQKSIRDAADGRMEKIKQTIMLDLGDNDTGFCGSYKVTWRSQDRRTFDAKRFAANNPHIDIENYYNTTTFRKFDIRR